MWRLNGLPRFGFRLNFYMQLTECGSLKAMGVAFKRITTIRVLSQFLHAINGVWYNGITHDSGSCNPGSIPGTPTKLNFFQIQRSFVARSPRRSLSRTALRERVSLRKKPCISELNRKVGQIQIRLFGKENGGSELRSNSQMKFVSNFSRFCQR